MNDYCFWERGINSPCKRCNATYSIVDEKRPKGCVGIASRSSDDSWKPSDHDINEHRKNPDRRENINHPSHYGGDTTYETIKVLRNWMTPEQFEGFLIGNSIKYLSRYRHKGGTDDLRKSKWYLDYLLQMERDK
jgi:Protein of unknwon function (DUF3310)